MSEKTLRVKRRGLTKTHATIDYKIWQWKTCTEQARNGQRVLKTEIQKFAFQSYKEAGINNFKASDGWYRRWRMRWQHLNNSNIHETNVIVEEAEPTKKDLALLNDEKPISKKNNHGGKINILRRNRKSTSVEHHKVSSAVSSNTIDSSLNCNAEKSSEVPVMELDPGYVVQAHANKLNVMQNLIDNTEQNHCINSKKLCTVLENDGLDLLNQVSCLETINHQPAATETSTQGVINVAQKCIVDGSSNDNMNRVHLDNDMETITSANCSSMRKCAHVDESVSLETIASVSVHFKSQGEPTCEEAEIVPENSTANNSFPKNSLNLNEDELGLEDHDLFCHSCEDFHPKLKGSNTRCKQTNNYRLLSSVAEKREPSSKINLLKKTSDRDFNKIKLNNLKVPEPRLKNSCTVRPKGKRYISQFKSEVVNFALENNLKKAAEKFKVNRGTVSDWLGEKKELRGNFQEGVKQISVSSDADFLQWLEDSKFNLTNELLKQQTAEWLLSSGNNNNGCLWLKMYAHRLNGSNDVSIKKRYIAYPPTFKRVVVFFAETHSNVMASRVFSVARRRILEWQRNTGEGKKVADDKFPCNVSDETVDKEVFAWFCRQKVPPNYSQVRKKALELYRKAGNQNIECKAQWYYRWRARHKLPPASKQGTPECEVKLLSWMLTQLDNNQSVTHAALTCQATALGYPPVARGWSFRFCKKHEKLLVGTPDPTTPLPPPLEQQILEYKQLVRHVVSSRNLLPSHILAVDEVPIQFLAKDVNKRACLVRRTGFESCQASLIVSSLSDGTLLPTIFVFKGLLPTCELKDTVISCASENGLINNEIMNLWLNEVLLKNLSNSEVGGLLIADCYELHTTEPVLAELRKHNICQAVIPGGCAFKLMPNLNLCLLFKSMLEEMCRLLLSNQTETLRPPSADQLYLWATQIHNHLAKDQNEDIKTAFNQKLFE